MRNASKFFFVILFIFSGLILVNVKSLSADVRLGAGHFSGACFNCGAAASAPVNQCTGTASAPGALGDLCVTGALGGGTQALYAGGPFADTGSWHYMITPSGCGADPAAPACNIANADSLTKTWGPNPSSPTPSPNSATEGLTNTNTLASYGATYPAAKYCYDLVWGGYDDWYLPGGTPPGGNGTAGAGEIYNVLYGMKLASKGNLLASSCWSSTEYSTNAAWSQNLNNGSQGNLSKTGFTYVRCVRRY